VSPEFTPVEPRLPPEHLLFVGGADPHKNLDLVLAALDAPAARALPPLVVVGAAAGDRRLANPRLQERIRPVAAADDHALASLYRRALALLVPSRNEGFGLPALEAMACACPVLAARAGALPEVCGDAAELLDPDNPAAWRETAVALLHQPERRAALARAGLARASTFTWARTARELAEVYRALTRSAKARS
jgi:glycosyltransferase involved in cell wall biosynthesis